jgi:hypothetical protein
MRGGRVNKQGLGGEFVFVYENRAMNLIEIVLRRRERAEEE